MRPASAMVSLLLLASFALAGCAGGDDATTPSPTGTTTSANPTSTLPSGGGGGAGGGGSGGENRPPGGSITASAMEGQIPMSVTFDLMGSDPDEDPITWNLDLEGDGITDRSGNSLPANESYNYTEAGVYNVTFVITDGQLSVTLQLTLNVTAALEGGPQEVFSGSWSTGAYGCALRRTSYDPAGDGIQYQTLLIDPSWLGKPYTVEFTSTAPSYFNAHINDVDGTRIDNWSSNPAYGGAPAPPETNYTFSGTLAPEANWAFFASCGGGAAVTLTVG